MKIEHMKLRKKGMLYELRESEIAKWSERSKNGTRYKYATIGKFKIEFTLRKKSEVSECKVTVPHNFLSDGADVAPDWGVSWLFHDYLYATHAVKKRNFECARGSGEKVFVVRSRSKLSTEKKIQISRKTADKIMSEVLRVEQLASGDAGEAASIGGYKLGFDVVSHCNVLGLFEKSWSESGERGPEFRSDE
jgi:hypothetical protein